MGLSEKYNRYNMADLVKQEIDIIPIDTWPRNRTQAIVVLGGEGDKILDIGCSNGRLLYQFRKTYKQLIGLDYSIDQVEQARINLEGFNFMGIVGSAESIPQLESNSIDRIISADTIEHVPDVYAAAEEMYRILKPGGVLVINTPNITFIKKRLLLLIGRFPSTSQANEGIGEDSLFDGGHLHYFTFRSLKLVLEKAGFVMLKKTGYGDFGRIHDIYPELLSGGAQWLAKKPF